MKNSRLILIGFLIAILSFVTACGSNNNNDEVKSDGNNGASNDGETITIKVPHVATEDDTTHLNYVKFKEDVEEMSDGRIEVEIFPNGQLYDSERAIVEAVQLGDIPLSGAVTSIMGSFAESFLVFDLPFLFDSREEAHNVVDGELTDFLMEEMDEIGLVGFGIGEMGFRHVLNANHAIEEPDDLKGLKMRVLENQLYQDMFNELGANASPLGFGEVYSALQQGTFDSMELTIPLTLSTQLYEVQDYLSLTSHIYSAEVFFANKEFMEDLPEDLREIIIEAGENMIERSRDLAYEQESGDLEELKELGMQVNDIPDDKKELFREKLKPVYEKYTDIIGEEVINIVEESKE